MFNGLQASTGMQAALGVMTFLDRLDALEKSPERKSTRKEDHAALETLAKRGIDENERAHLRKLTKIVATSPDLDLDGVDEDEAKREEERQKALVALRAWFIDWSETARSLIPRRDYLIRLGLASRLRQRPAHSRRHRHIAASGSQRLLIAENGGPTSRGRDTCTEATTAHVSSRSLPLAAGSSRKAPRVRVDIAR